MAEFLQLSYYDIAIAAAIPAILYYMAVFVMVDLEAVRPALKVSKKRTAQGQGSAEKVVPTNTHICAYLRIDYS